MATSTKKSPAKKRVTPAKKVQTTKARTVKTVSKAKAQQSKDNTNFEVLATVAFTILALMFFGLIIIKYSY